MIDVTDRHCRYFHRLLAPQARLYTEMITTGALMHGDVARHLDFDPSEQPVALQLGGSEPQALADCARLGEQWGYDEINLNCGCPSERVQRGAFGACLMAEPDLVADIRNVVEGDPSPDGRGTLAIQRGIEVGHVFFLGTKYSKAMNATYLDETGKPQLMQMGCYGIGVTRIVGAAIEQNHDERGIIWPDALAPFTVVICPIGYDRSTEVQAAADQLHDQLQAQGVDVMLDNRGERPGAMFADWELVGIPHRVVISDRGLKEGKVEYQGRRDAQATSVGAAEIAGFVTAKLA